MTKRELIDSLRGIPDDAIVLLDFDTDADPTGGTAPQPTGAVSYDRAANIAWMVVADEDTDTTGPLSDRVVDAFLATAPADPERAARVRGHYDRALSATANVCVHCGEPQDGGSFGWFDHPADGLRCNACGYHPRTGVTHG